MTDNVVPLENYVCREVIEEYFFKDRPFSQRRHVITTACIVFSTMCSMFPAYFLLPSVWSMPLHIGYWKADLVVSLLTCDLGVVLEIAGGLSATALAFIVSLSSPPLLPLLPAPFLCFPPICHSRRQHKAEGVMLIPSAVPCISLFRPHKRTMVLSCQITSGHLYRLRYSCTSSQLWSYHLQSPEWGEYH